MAVYRVSDQYGLNVALGAVTGPEDHVIISGATERLQIHGGRVEIEDGSLDASGATEVHADGSAIVSGRDDVTVYAKGRSQVFVYGHARAIAREQATVRAWHHATVEAHDAVRVDATATVTVVVHNFRDVIVTGEAKKFPPGVIVHEAVR